MPLAKDAHLEFSAGIFPAVARHLIPESGVYDALNALTDDDGSLYRRGGSTYRSSNGLGSAGLTWAWDGILVPGARTVLSSPASFGVLAADDTTIVDLAAGGVPAPTHAVEVDDLLFIGGGWIYGGSRKTAGYSTGTVQVTEGSKTVTGSGTSWAANVDAGMLFRFAPFERYYVVGSVESDTQLTLTSPYRPTSQTGPYSLSVTALATGPYRPASVYATVAGRLITVEGNRVYFSNSALAGGEGPHRFDATDYHQLPHGVEGIGAAASRDTLLVFTTGGVWAISNMLFDLVDDFGNVQHRVERVSEDLVLWSHAGIATWGNSLIVPAIDGVWLVDAVSGPRRLSNSITPLYTGYVRSSLKTGTAVVYRNHYLLPILDPGNTVIDCLVCRLDRRTQSPVGEVYAWTRLGGHAANVTALAVRAGGNIRLPRLLAASKATASRLLDLSSIYEPSEKVKNDADGTTHRWEVTLRDLPTGSLNVNTARRVRVRYELVDAAADNPTIQLAYGPGTFTRATGPLWDAANWDEVNWAEFETPDWIAIAGNAPEDDGLTPYVWEISKDARYVRYRLRSDSPAARLVLRSVEQFVSQWGRA